MNILQKKKLPPSLGVREKKFEVLNIKLERLITIQKVLTATLNDGVLNENAKTIVFLKFQTSLEFYHFI